MDSRLRLNLLGTPTLVSGTDTVALSPGATMLFAYLALAPRGGRLRSAAAAQLFADCTMPTARRRLNTALWRLKAEVRSSIGVEIVDNIGGPSVGLSPTVEVTVDAAVFEELVAPVLHVAPANLTDADAKRLESAVAMHRGELMEPCHEEWVLSKRNRIENLYLSALDYLIQYHGARGDLNAVTEYGELALALEPLREDVHRHLMSAYASTGRKDLVERQFERCRATLFAELGADPMPETLALYARLTHTGSGQSESIAALVAELERARREVGRLGEIVDRAIDRLRHLS